MLKAICLINRLHYWSRDKMTIEEMTVLHFINNKVCLMYLSKF